MNESNQPHMGTYVKVPDEIWFNVLQLNRCCHAGGFLGAVRLFDGKVIEQMIVSDRGYILGRVAPGLAGGHGDIDGSMLTFSTDEIEAVQVPAFRFWQRPQWVALNPQHPLRQKGAGGRAV